MYRTCSRNERRVADGALSVDGYRNALGAAGFLAIRTRDVSGVLSDMIARIERRVSTVKHFLSEEQLGLPDGFSVPRSRIAEARDFVASGGVGYALITAKKSRTD